jgi:hypothetical protein
MIESDWYAGVWKPFNQLRQPASWRAAVPTFDPLAQEREEPILAWFTKGELAAWRVKFLETAPIPPLPLSSPCRVPTSTRLFAPLRRLC